MALKKIKDLIREMIFETSAHEHEYANVMANLVFNRSTDYDAVADDAISKDTELNIKKQKINNALDKKNQKIKMHGGKKNTMPAEEFRAAMIKLNKQKGILTELQHQTIDERMRVGFASIDPVTKKYACLRHLANKCIKQEDLPTIENENDKFIYADEDAFKSSQTAIHFREIADYVDYIFGARESKITEPQSIIEIIKNDAKELGMNLGELTAENIPNIYNNLLNRIAEENKAKQTEAEQIEQSQIGVKLIQDFGDGLAMYRLLPDTEYYNEHGEHRNLVYESNQMGICIGQKTQSYSKKILETKENQYYTLRSREKNGQLVPHCTIEVNGDTISQVKGKSNGPVNSNYIKPVREFLKNRLNCAFPGEEADGKRKLYDYSNIGFIQDVHDQTVDIFNLPENTELDRISYALLSTRGFDIKNIKTINTISVVGEKITQSYIDKINKFTDKVKGIAINSAKLYGDLDFGVESLELYNTDLSNVTSIKFNNINSLDLSNAKGLHGDLDFSGVGYLHLDHTDLSNVTNMKFNNINRLDLRDAKGLHGNLDFNGVKELYLYNTDLSNVTNMKFNNIYSLYLSSATGLHGDLDFSGVEYLRLDHADLSNVTNMKFNNINALNLDDAKGLHGDLDFSGVKVLDLRGTDFSNVTNIKFNPKATILNLSNAKGLHGDLDFSGVESLELYHTDLSNVTSIKFNNINRLDLHSATGLHGDLDFSGVKELYLYNIDVTNMKFNNINRLDLRSAGLHGDLDFSGVKELYLYKTDLSNVTSIKFKPMGYIRGISKEEQKRLKKKNMLYKITHILSRDPNY